ncbi:MAG: hypothetical protein PHW34_10520 [Hespellia sp.]|nr:hypothetical protein [Hespellia sp.]
MIEKNFSPYIYIESEMYGNQYWKKKRKRINKTLKELIDLDADLNEYCNEINGPFSGKMKKKLAILATREIQNIYYYDHKNSVRRGVSKKEISKLMLRCPKRMSCYSAIIIYVLLKDIDEHGGFSRMVKILTKEKGDKLVLNRILKNTYNVIRQMNSSPRSDFLKECICIIEEKEGTIKQLRNNKKIKTIESKEWKMIPVIETRDYGKSS